MKRRAGPRTSSAAAARPRRCTGLGALRVAFVVIGLHVLAPEAMSAGVSQVVYGAGAAAGKLVDLRVGLSFAHEARTARLRREVSGTNGPLILASDLKHDQRRNVLALRGDLGLLGGVSLFATLPIVLSDERELSFDDRVNADNSTLLRDAFLPGRGGASYGWDADRNRPFLRPDGRVFRGPTRRGVLHLGLGLAWALMDQRREEAWPTWIARAEARLSVDDEMSYEPVASRANGAVGSGYHELAASTVFTKTIGQFEPFVGASYTFALPTSGGAFSRAARGSGAFSRPRQRAAIEAGVEATAWEAPRDRKRVTVGLRTGLELRFAGLERGELWEVLSGSKTCPDDPNACRPELDRDRDGDGRSDPASGITRGPRYGLFSTDAIIGVELGRYVRLRVLFGLHVEQDRFLTDGRSREESYDLPGRRYRISEARLWRGGGEVLVAF